MGRKSYHLHQRDLRDIVARVRYDLRDLQLSYESQAMKFETADPVAYKGQIASCDAKAAAAGRALNTMTEAWTEPKQRR